MKSVYMHVDGNGVIWALAKCRVCGEVHKYRASEVVEGQTMCKTCKRRMSLEGAVFTSLQCPEVQRPHGDRALSSARSNDSAN